MLSFSPIKLLIVLVVAAILVGPDKLPQVARQLGAAWRAFRSFHERVENEVRQTIPDLPSTTEIARLARSPVAFLNQLADLPKPGAVAGGAVAGGAVAGGAVAGGAVAGGAVAGASGAGAGDGNATANGAAGAVANGIELTNGVTGADIANGATGAASGSGATGTASGSGASGPAAAPDPTSHGAVTPPPTDPSMN